MKYKTTHPQVKQFAQWAKDNVKQFKWSEGHCYSETHWLGGICDVGYEKLDGTFGIGDFKSAKGAYFEHGLQIAGYNLQISENGIFDCDGNSLYKLEKPITQFIVVPFGAANVVPHVLENVEELQKTFLNALELYKVMNKYEAV